MPDVDDARVAWKAAVARCVVLGLAISRSEGMR